MSSGAAKISRPHNVGAEGWVARRSAARVQRQRTRLLSVSRDAGGRNGGSDRRRQSAGSPRCGSLGEPKQPSQGWWSPADRRTVRRRHPHGAGRARAPAGSRDRGTCCDSARCRRRIGLSGRQASPSTGNARAACARANARSSRVRHYAASQMTTVRRVGVLGGGLMGSGIAQVSAMAGFPTVVREVSDSLCEKALASIRKSLAKGVERGKVTTEARDATLSNLTCTTEVAELAESDIVIEAVSEDLELKNSLWKVLNSVCPPETIFASNTSSLTIAAMAVSCGRPDRMLGLHFFNPVPLMKLVEVVRTITTSDETADTAFAFVELLGKEPIRAKDNSGFVVNLLLVPYMLDAIRALEANVATVEDIDKGMQLGAGYPMGPFTLLDFVGLDTVHKISEIMFAEYREKRYAPPPLLNRMVTVGMHGRKSGRGFYDYSEDPPRPSALGL